jgi:hypothetical protein
MLDAVADTMVTARCRRRRPPGSGGNLTPKEGNVDEIKGDEF